MNASITVLAPAKINLALAVGKAGGQASGIGPQASDASSLTPHASLHPICSWMVTVDLFDEMLLMRLPAGRLSRYAILWHEEAKRRSDINWSITKDLAVRAHQAMEQHLGRALPVQMKLEKRIPVGGGLGGGSADAAAMLRGLNELFDLELSSDELAAIGATIGSDVSFLVHGGSALVEGFGEKIERQEVAPEFHAVLVFPEASCPTGRVYQLFDESVGADHEMRADAVRSLIGEWNANSLTERTFNDLAAAALRSAPSLQEDLERLAALAERRAHVSGSGSTLFVICDDAMHAEALAPAVEERLKLPAVAVRAHDSVAMSATEPRS